jgi:hypothetical protein
MTRGIRAATSGVIGAKADTALDHIPVPANACRARRASHGEIFARYLTPLEPATDQRLGGGYVWDFADPLSWRTVPVYGSQRATTLPLRKRKRPEPDPLLAGAIVRAMGAGNCRSNIVRDHNELVRRLREDRVEFKVSDVLTVLSKMIGEGRIKHRDGVGFWLSNGTTVLTGSDWTNLADIDGPSWG